MNVYPTHSCFDDTGEIVIAFVDGGRRTADLRIVHAICRAPNDNSVLYAHAWVEDVAEDMVWFVGVINGERAILGARRDEYETTMNIVEMVRYTLLEAHTAAKQLGDAGPWIPRYRDLCNDSKRVFQ